MNKTIKSFIWIAIAILGAFALSAIALNRGERINALWLITAAACIYAIAYRFYAAWIAAKVLVIDVPRLLKD
jgi:carbon starvation protein